MLKTNQERKERIVFKDPLELDSKQKNLKQQLNYAYSKIQMHG